MLPEKLAHALKDTQKNLLNEGDLPSVDKLQGYYATFRERFGPEVLRNLDGELLLTTMHSHDRNNRNSVVYWLEFKNDEEFPFIFGSISGGSALKFGVYQNAKSGAWMSRDQSNSPVEITLEEAIEIARRHRDQLLNGVALLDKLPANGSDSDYQNLQTNMNEQAPDVSGLAWGHKYFSLLYPNKLDDYHSAYYQRFHLVKLLQPDIPAERDGRYIAAGRFVALAQELNMSMNHLTTVLNHYNGRPYRYWSVLATDPHNPNDLNWKMQHDGGFAAITWSELGDLSELTHNSQSKKDLRQMMEPIYPSASTSERQGIFNFATDIAIDDRIVAFEPRGRKVVGFGKVTGDYYFEPSSAPHRRPVQWYETEEWQFPVEEGFDTAAKEIRAYANQVEIERLFLDAPQIEATEQSSIASSHSLPSTPVRLTGIPGRIQNILERKGQVILYGPPGTGKTYWAEITACELVARQVYGKSFSQLDKEQSQRIFGSSDSYVQLSSFHPAYGYEDFLEGYRPQLVNDQMTFIRQNGIFKQLCELARKDSGRNYYLIVDEINRGDIPRIFGELLTVLEKDKRGKAILLPLSGESFTVPQNLFVIGTMNTADRSIALLDTALRRRFGFIELLPDPSQLASTIVAGIPLGGWLEELNKRILQYVGRDARNLQVGHAYLLEKGKPITDFSKLARVIREDIVPLLEEYCYEDYGSLKQILGPTLVDDKNQVIRHDLFEPGRENDLVQALLEPTPDLTTLASVTEAETEEDEMVEDDDNSNNESQE